MILIQTSYTGSPVPEITDAFQCCIWFYKMFNGNGKGVAAAVGGAIAAAASDDPKIAQINELLDERIRPYLAGDGGWLEVLDLQADTLTIRYEGACGSCPSSLTGTLMAIENMIKEEIDPAISVVAV